jgi:uncharacterized protein YunC (DUF1805 family)
MPVKVSAVQQSGVAAESIEVSWNGGQFVLIIAPKGLVACGVVDPAVMNRFGAAVAVARGTPQRPLVTTDDLLAAPIAEVTDSAAALGIAPGMTGAAALERLR